MRGVLASLKSSVVQTRNDNGNCCHQTEVPEFSGKKSYISLCGFAQGEKDTGGLQLLSLNSLISRSSGSLQIKNEKSERGKNCTSWLHYQQITPAQHGEKGKK